MAPRSAPHPFCRVRSQTPPRMDQPGLPDRVSPALRRLLLATMLAAGAVVSVSTAHAQAPEAAPTPTTTADVAAPPADAEAPGAPLPPSPPASPPPAPAGFQYVPAAEPTSSPQTALPRSSGWSTSETERGPSPKKVQYRWGGEVSARIVQLSTSGYEPYTSSDTFTSSVLGGHYQLLTEDRWSVLVGGEWGVGSLDNTTGAARGQPASLTAHRFALGGIVRYRATRWLYPAARLMPYAQYVRASVTPTDSPSRYDARVWGAGADATLGAHFVPITIGDADWPSARIWLFVEAGWTMTTKSDMKFSPHQAEDDPRRLNDLHLPKLALSGYLTRFGLSASF